jgi:hypothetical protein
VIGDLVIGKATLFYYSGQERDRSNRRNPETTKSHDGATEKIG